MTVYRMLLSLFHEFQRVLWSFHCKKLGIQLQFKDLEGIFVRTRTAIVFLLSSLPTRTNRTESAARLQQKKMQEIHSSIDGGCGGDVRLRPPHNQQPHSDHHELKCPRCDSVNTKFCYYNNYNFSQPRYICKGCRRYWTKGGLLRNVPVGGGCRKTKRSSSKTKKSSSDQSTESTAVKLPRKRKSRPNSSSDSSSLTATAPTAESVSATSLTTPADICGYKSSVMADGMFSEIGTSFTSLIASSGYQSLFGFNSVLDPQNLERELKLQSEIPTAAECLFADQKVVEVDLPPLFRPSMFGPLDWQPNVGHQGLFDLPNAVDQAYWSQTSQWTDADQIQPSIMYLP